MPLPSGLTPKQEGFAKEYLETGNGTQAIKNNYDTENESTAASMASENLRKPKVIEFLQSVAEECANNVYKLAMSSESDVVKLNASKDVLDRAGYKPTERSEQTIKSEVTVVNDALIEEYEKKLRDSICPEVLEKTA